MSEYPIGSTAKVYYDIENNPRPLFWMVRNEFDWAASRIIEGEKAIAENAKLRNIAETALKLRGRLKEVGIDTPWLDGALQEAGYNT